MKLKRRKKRSDEIPASSTSDIAFLLIIFFLVLAVFAVKEGFFLNTPDQNKVVKRASSDIFRVKLVENRLFVAETEIKKENLKQEIKTRKKNQRTVVFEISKKTLYREVIYVLDIFAELKILDFSMKEIEG